MIITYPGPDYYIIRYPAGELQVRLRPDRIPLVHAMEEVQIDARIKNSEELMGLVLLANALHGIKPDVRLILNIPYLPYGRADRRFVDGDCFGLQTLGHIFHFCRFDKIITLDVHNSKQAYTHVSSFLVNRSPGPLIDLAREDFRPTAILFPDSGAWHRYHQFLKGLPMFAVIKKRDESTGKLISFDIPDLEGHKRLLIVDDLCDAGGTFTGIAEALRQRGWAGELGLFVTHGIFSKGIVGSGIGDHFRKIYTTNSFQDDLKIASVTFYDAFGEL